MFSKTKALREGKDILTLFTLRVQPEQDFFGLNV